MINKLKCEYCENPIGIDTDSPYFSWSFDEMDNEMYQDEYRILVKNDNQKVWDTGFVKSKKTFNIEYAGLKLENFEKYIWKVYVKTTGGDIIESEESFFVTGFIDRTKIDADWIEHPSLHDNPIFYGDYFVKKDLKSAYIAISGLGYYELKINGKRGHDTYNVPGWTDYSKRDLNELLYPYIDNSEKKVLYNVYDIGDYQQEGINRFEIMLGNGFFNQVERLIEGDMSYGTPRLFMEIHLAYKDGEETVILSNEETYCTDGSLEFNNIYFGEIKNDNIGLDFSGELTAMKCSWDPGGFSSQYDYFDKIIDELNPIKINSHIYDVGKSISGRVKIKAKAPRGAQFIIRYFDAINDDNSPNYKSTGGEWQIQENKYIFGDNNEVNYAESFGWRGFRYFAIEKDDDVEILQIKAEVINTSINSNTSLETDNPVIQWIYNAFKNSQTSNMHGGVPSDCPHRERLGYTGDGQVVAESSLTSLNCINFMRKWNSDIVASQNSESGFIPHTVPFNGGGGGPAWGSACAIVPSKIYSSIFDKRVIHESYSAIQKWIKYLEEKNPNLIIEKEEDGSWCLGDWCIPVEGYEVEDVKLDKIFEELSPALVNTSYFYECVKICIEFGKKISRDTTYYERLADRIKRKFNDEFLNRSTYLYSNGKHGSNVYPLYFDLVYEKDVEKVRSALIRQIEKTGYKMDMGIFATSMIFQVLVDAKRDDILNKMLLVDEYPSYGYMKNSGATNLWETWDGKASLNHPMFGGMVSSFFKYLGGIRYISNDGRILIEPIFLDSINKIDITKTTIFGDIKVKWKKTNENKSDSILLELFLPGNVQGAIKYNDEALLAGNGMSIFKIDCKKQKIKKVEL